MEDKRRRKLIILGVIVVLLLIDAIYLWQNVYCYNESDYQSFVRDVLSQPEYKICSVDSDCKTVTECNICVNSRGVEKYKESIRPFCRAYPLPCTPNIGCNCIDGTCIKQPG